MTASYIKSLFKNYSTVLFFIIKSFIQFKEKINAQSLIHFFIFIK